MTARGEEVDIVMSWRRPEVAVVILSALMTEVLVTGVCAGTLTVHRSVGQTTDRFTIQLNGCSCAELKGTDLTSSKSGVCECSCEPTRGTFSVTAMKCVTKTSDCAILAITSAQTNVFTFRLTQNSVEPKVAVLNSEQPACSDPKEKMFIEEESSWKEIVDPAIHLQRTIDNETYLSRTMSSESTDGFTGSLVKITKQCTMPSEFNRCWLVKFEGDQQVNYTKTSTSPVTVQTTEAQRKLDVTDFYWIAGVCIGVLVIAVVAGLGLACHSSSCCRPRRKSPTLQIDRLDLNGNIVVRETRAQSDGRSNRLSPPTRNSRRAIYTKNPSRLATSPREGRNFDALTIDVGRAATPVSARSSQRDVVRSPRDDLRSSRNSATFLVSNEHISQPEQIQADVETRSQLRTRIFSPYYTHIYNNNSLRNSHSKRRVKAARLALNEFEGIRCSNTDALSQDEIILQHKNGDIFSRPNCFERAEASILAMTKNDKPKMKRKKLRNRHRWMRKRSVGDSSSKFSLDLETFELGSPDDHSEQVLQGAQQNNNPTSSPREYHDINMSHSITAEEFYNTATRMAQRDEVKAKGQTQPQSSSGESIVITHSTRIEVTDSPVTYIDELLQNPDDLPPPPHHLLEPDSSTRL